MRRATLSFLPFILISSRFASAQPLPIQDLGLLPGDAIVSPADNSQLECAMAKGGDRYLVVWSDSRGTGSGSQTIQSDGDIFGIRLDGAGNPLDAIPFQIAGGMGLQRYPTVAWNGENWLVIYQSQDPIGGYFETQIRAVRVSPEGVILDATPILLPPTQFTPGTIGMTVAGQAGQWLITRCIYHNDGYGTFLAGQRISGTGALLDATPIMLNDWVYGQTKTIVSNGEYLVVGPDWNNSGTIKARRIGLNAQPIGASFNVPSLNIAGNGSEYYVTWIAEFVNVVGSRMTGTGTLLSPAGTFLCSDPSIQYYHTNLSYDGVNWWFEWGAASTLRTLRIGPGGNVLDPGGVQLPIGISGITQAYGVQLAPAEGGGLQLAWWDGRPALGGDANVFLIPVSAANVPGIEHCVSTGTSSQRNSDFCNGASDSTAVVFVSEAANDDAVLVHLLDSAGAPTAPEPIEVYRGPKVGKAGIAFNGTIFMIVFDVGTSGLTPIQIKARRMNTDGSFLDAEPFDVMSGFNPDIEALGANFLVAGARYSTNPQFIYLWANRIDGPSGAVLDGSTGVYLGGAYVSGVPRVRSDGAQWFVAAHSMWSHDSSQGDAILARVPPVGTPTQAINPTPISGGSGDLDIAFSGKKYLLVWRMNSLSNANNYIAGRIMNADGTFPPGYFTIAEAPGRQLRPTVSWDGATFIVAWDDQRNQAAFFDARTDVYGARVSENGVVLDETGFPIHASPDGDASPAILSKLNGLSFVSSTRFLPTSEFDSYRVGITQIGLVPIPGDIDGDGDVDLVDCDLFVAVLLDMDSDPAHRLARSDVNADGSANGNDIQLFMAALIGG